MCGQLFPLAGGQAWALDVALHHGQLRDGQRDRRTFAQLIHPPQVGNPLFRYGRWAPILRQYRQAIAGQVDLHYVAAGDADGFSQMASQLLEHCLRLQGSAEVLGRGIQLAELGRAGSDLRIQPGIFNRDGHLAGDRFQEAGIRRGKSIRLE